MGRHRAEDRARQDASVILPPPGQPPHSLPQSFYGPAPDLFLGRSAPPPPRRRVWDTIRSALVGDTRQGSV